MVSRAVSLRISDELLTKLESDGLEGESLGGTIQRILSQHYALTIDDNGVDHIQQLVSDEVKKQVENLTAGYYDLKSEVDSLKAEVVKLQTPKTTRKKPLTS